MKPAARKEERVDPFFQALPWEIHRDEQQKVIGEVYLIPRNVRDEGKWKGVRRYEKIHRD